MKKAKCDEVFREVASGAKTARPVLDDLLKRLRQGDVLVIWKLDRLARSLTHIVTLTNELMERKIGLISLNDPIDTTTPQGRLMCNIFASLAEFERDLICERTQAGLIAARALEHDPPTFLLHTATEQMRFNRILRPGLTILEQIISAARQRAREITFERVLPLLSPQRKRFLDNLLVPDESGSRTTLSWLQRIPNDHTAPQILATLLKIRFLQNAEVLNWDLSPINPNRLKFLANIGARATNQQMQRANQMRRYPVLIAFLKQTLFLMTDVVINLFDACLWQRHTDAKKELDEMRLKAARETNEKLRTYNEVVKILIDSEVKDAAVRAKVFGRFNRGYLQQVVPPRLGY